MNEFPFTEAEWKMVGETARAFVNAALVDYEILKAAHFAELQAVLTELRERYGDHPILLETEADFTDDPAAAADLYRQAVGAAQLIGLPTHSIRLSLARLLLDSDQPQVALAELEACRNDIVTFGDGSDREEWQKLRVNCEAVPLNNLGGIT